MINFSELRESFKRNGPLFALVSTIGGFFSDVLQPIAPFCYFIFVASAIIAVISFFGTLIKGTYREVFMRVLVFCCIALLVSGFMLILQKVADEGDGVLSEVMPGVAALQKSLGIIERDVAEIKETTKAIKKDTADIKTVSHDIKRDTGDIKTAVKKIEKTIEGLDSLSGAGGGIISNPDIPEEFYHNARIYELNGDYGNARRSYIEYFKFEVDYIDPHVRFQKFLKIQEGFAGAREIYQEMFRNSENHTAQYASLLLLQGDKKTTALEDFVSQHSDFAPAFYDLSRQYSEAVLGTQSLSDKRREKELLDSFLGLVEDGSFFGLYIDKEEADRIINDANERRKALDVIAGEAFDNPITVSANFAMSDWLCHVNIAETTNEIFLKRENDTEFTSLGLSTSVSPVTGKPFPNTMFRIVGGQSSQNLQFKYIDITGTMRGPFDYYFNPNQEKEDSNYRNLKDYVGLWVYIIATPYLNQISFQTLIENRCALRSVRYGVNVDTPDTELPLPSCESSFETASRYAAVEVGASISHVTVQLEFADGTKSKIERFTPAQADVYINNKPY